MGRWKPVMGIAPVAGFCYYRHMTTLSDLFDLGLFYQNITDDYITVRPHPDGELCIANYTPLAQYSRKWDEVTEQCRGLIFEEHSYKVVSRPFRKFYNFDDSSQPNPPGGQCFVMPKMDGSLGILYRHPDAGWGIATRGSFTSNQATKATEMFKDAYVGTGAIPHLGKTYLFEIIYPENRIVVNYGNSERLVLLDVIDNESGKSDLEEFYAFEWPDKVERKMVTAFSDTIIHEIPKGEEGFVIHWPYRDYRVKMKSAEYLELHRIVTGLSARTVWEQMVAGKSKAEIIAPLPDELHGWTSDVFETIMNDVTRILTEAFREFNRIEKSLLENYSRKEFAAIAKHSKLAPYMFLLLDKRMDAVKELAFKSVRPAGDWKPVHNEEDE